MRLLTTQVDLGAITALLLHHSFAWQPSAYLHCHYDKKMKTVKTARLVINHATRLHELTGRLGGMRSVCAKGQVKQEQPKTWQ